MTLVMLSMSVKASCDHIVLITSSCTMMLDSHKAFAGTLFLFSRANTFGMSRVFAAANRTSAQMSDQARYAPSTEMINPALTKIAPHGPTTASSTAAIDG